MEDGIQLHMEADDKTKNNDSVIQGEQYITGRYAMAGVIAYWRSNLGSAWALKYWEQQLKANCRDLHI
jgi:hypothetical protein